MPPCRAGPWNEPWMRSGSSFLLTVLVAFPSTTGNIVTYFSGPISELVFKNCMDFSCILNQTFKEIIYYLFIQHLHKFLSYIFIYNFYFLLFIVSILTYPNCFLLNYLAALFAIFVVKSFHSSLVQTREFYSLVDLYLSIHILFSETIFFGLYEANPCSGSI